MFYEQQFPQMQLHLYRCLRLVCVFLHMYVCEKETQRVSNEQIKSQQEVKIKTETQRQSGVSGKRKRDGEKKTDGERK